jgi:methyl-accepting chemotaxis protein
MLAEQISNASDQQVRATRTVVHSIQMIASVTQESSAGAMETSKAVKDMDDLSYQLTAAIARFKIDVE